MKNSQLAIFMIFGITMLVLIGLAYYGVSHSSEGAVNAKQQQFEQLFLDKGKYSAYIKSCLAQATKQGLFLVGEQGGVIYASQTLGGKIENVQTTKYYNHSGVLVHYATTAPIVSISGTSKKVPEYPFKTSLIVPGFEPFLNMDSSVYGYIYPDTPFTGLISNDPFIPLCDRFGPNSHASPGNAQCGNAPKMYDTTSQSDHNSVQEYLQKYISQKTNDCIKIENLPELSGFDIKKENVHVDVTLSESTVVSTLNMSISMSLDQSLPKIKIEGIKVETDVRLRQIFELLATSVQEDNKNIFFETNDAALLTICGQNAAMPCLKPGMIVERVLLPSKDTILRITDTESLIDGKPYKYQVVMANRYPALDYTKAQKGNCKGITFQSKNVDVVLVEGMTLNLEPRAYDPDEDKHISDYMGNDAYTYSFKSWDGTKFVDGYTKFDKGDDLNPACIVTDSDSSNLNAFASSIKTCLTPAPAPQQFSGRIINYPITEKDVGVHILKINACDYLNQCDWQELQIFVLPKQAFKYIAQTGYIVNGNPISLFEGDTIKLTSPSPAQTPITPLQNPPQASDQQPSDQQQGQPQGAAQDDQPQQDATGQEGQGAQGADNNQADENTPFNSKDIIVLITRGFEGSKIPYEMYYHEGMYLIAKKTINYEDLVIVPPTDQFREFAEKGGNVWGSDAADGKLNLNINMKIYDKTPQSSVMTSLIPGKSIYFIYVPGPCNEGGFHKGYCTVGNVCYSFLKIENFNLAEVHGQCTAPKKCTSSGCS